MNMANHLVRAGHTHANAPAVAVGKRVVRCYAELAERAARIGAALRVRFKLEPGDRVALVLNNCPEYLELLYGCWHAGLVAVPVNAKLHPSEFEFIFSNSGARVVFASGALASTVESAQPSSVEHIVPLPSADYDGLLATAPGPLVSRVATDPAWLFYTSGTTGRPKGATLTHRNLAAMCFCYFADVDPGGRWGAIAHAAPMSHGSGLYALAHVICGSCHVIPESASFDPDEIFSLIAHWPGLCLFAAPTMLKRLVNHDNDQDCTHLKTIMYGGGPMYASDCRKALDRFGAKLSQLYGQGESPMTITALNAALHAQSDNPRWLERLSSVGVAQSAVEVCVADSNDVALAAHELGEVLVRGDSVMAGYWNDEKATAETLRGGWLHTGDIGVFDDDGFLTLKDRSKDLIISGGSNIYPREIEEALLRHADVAEVSVIGRHDPEWGEIVVAYVVPSEGKEIEPDVLDRHCLQQLARFKRPRRYETISELPKNNYGKVLKTSLREKDRATK